MFFSFIGIRPPRRELDNVDRLNLTSKNKPLFLEVGTILHITSKNRPFFLEAERAQSKHKERLAKGQVNLYWINICMPKGTYRNESYRLQKLVMTISHATSYIE